MMQNMLLFIFQKGDIMGCWHRILNRYYQTLYQKLRIN